MTARASWLRRAGIVAALAGAALAGGCSCGRKAEPGGAAAAPAGAPFETAVLASLKGAGFSPGAFRPAAADAYGARRCVRGPIDRLDVLLCEYPSADAAKAAAAPLRGFLAGAVTGASRAAGDLAMAVADRDKVDLQGKTTNRLLRVFVGQPPEAPPPRLPPETKK